MATTTESAPDGAPAPPDPATTAPSGRARRIRIAATVVFVLWITIVWFTGRGARTQLLTAHEAILMARDEISDGNLTPAVEHLEVAEWHLGKARSALFRPDVSLAAAVPILGNDLTIGRALAVGVEDVVVQSRIALDHTSELLGRDLPDGALPVAAIAELAPDVRSATTAAVSAVAALEATPRTGIFEESAIARIEALDLLTDLAAQLTTTADLVEQLPDFLGMNGPRRYFLGAANIAELRGVGGYLGSYAILTIEDGRLDFGTFEPLFELSDLEDDEATPELLAERYERFAATRDWKNVNMTPDAPSAGRVITTMWETSFGEQLDGVILVDPFALASMLAVTGPVEIAPNFALDDESAVPYLTNEAYTDFDDSVERKEELGEAAKAILSAFLGDAGAAIDHLKDLSSVVEQRHLVVYASDPVTQAAFAGAGLDGAMPDPKGDFFMVVANSAHNAKVDFYLTPTYRYRVRLGDNGLAHGTLDIDLRNTAPRNAQRSYVLGPTLDGLGVGENRMYLSTYCAKLCEILGGTGGLTGRSILEYELDHPVAGTWVEIPAGETESLQYEWETAEAWSAIDGELVYRLTIRPQVIVLGTAIEVSMEIPPGFTFAGGTGGIESSEDEAGVLVWKGFPRRDLNLEFRLTANDAA